MGQSGSLFFFTPDRRYILKSMTKGELNTLTKKFIHNFTHYLAEGYIDTLIARIYGAYTITIDGFK